MVQMSSYLEQVEAELNETEALRAENDVLQNELNELRMQMESKDSQLNEIEVRPARAPRATLRPISGEGGAWIRGAPPCTCLTTHPPRPTRVHTWRLNRRAGQIGRRAGKGVQVDRRPREPGTVPTNHARRACVRAARWTKRTPQGITHLAGGG